MKSLTAIGTYVHQYHPLMLNVRTEPRPHYNWQPQGWRHGRSHGRTASILEYPGIALAYNTNTTHVSLGIMARVGSIAASMWYGTRTSGGVFIWHSRVSFNLILYLSQG